MLKRVAPFIRSHTCEQLLIALRLCLYSVDLRGIRKEEVVCADGLEICDRFRRSLEFVMNFWSKLRLVCVRFACAEVDRSGVLCSRQGWGQLVCVDKTIVKKGSVSVPYPCFLREFPPAKGLKKLLRNLL